MLLITFDNRKYKTYVLSFEKNDLLIPILTFLKLCFENYLFSFKKILNKSNYFKFQLAL